MSRPYTKKNQEYWNNISKKPQISASIPTRSQPKLNFEFFGDNLMAACNTNGDNQTRYKGTNSLYANGLGGFENLNTFPAPYELSNGRWTISRAISLILKAYAGFPVFRNAIEVLVEFTNTPLHIKGGNAQSREYVKAIFDKIQIDKLKEAFIREWYRSGNVFLVRYDGKLRPEDEMKVTEIQGAKNPTIPIMYVLLNPMNIFVENGIITNRHNYVKMLSTFEIESLKNPRTDAERQMYEQLPNYVKTQIKNWTVGLNSGIFIPIEPDKLYYVFYKKQPYEPLGVPLGFGILNDIEWKLQLKRVDMAMTRSVEHALLLVTNGEKIDDNGNGGIVPENIQSLQNLFKNPTIGRVLVADYTTKAEWVIPDFKELLGPDKYTIVDRDIKEGLQSILVGEDKFANAVIKARVFKERLKEGQRAFLRDFLNPEIVRWCKEMNFKKIPTVEFEEVSLEDDSNLHKLYTRWAELGILSPWELVRAKETGLLPDKDTNIENQKEFKELRDKDYYYPLVGASSSKDEEGRPSGSSSPMTKKTVGVAASKKEGFSTKALVKNTASIMELFTKVEKSFMAKYKLKTLNDTQKDLAASVSKAIAVNEQNWSDDVIASYLASPKEMNKDAAVEVDNIRVKYDVDEFSAILLLKSKL